MTAQNTIDTILAAETWAQRIAQIRLVPQRHGTGEHATIFAAVARSLYMPHLAPDFAYIHDAPFYDPPHFYQAYDVACQLTDGFKAVSTPKITNVLRDYPGTLLVFRTLLGLTKEEFAYASVLAGARFNRDPLSASQVDNMERTSCETAAKLTGAALERGVRLAIIAAVTIVDVMNNKLFGDAPPGMRSKQQKADTSEGWKSAQDFAENGVPFKTFLHQRHYGGAFRQVLDATSSKRGDLIEDAVSELFTANGISFVRTGAHNQADIVRRFEVHVTPAPDFVVFDPIDDSLKAMLECKGTNNGGTARDKALRFARLRNESIRLGGVPLIAVLGGIGWARINDALGPVVRDTDGRVFTLSTLHSMLEVAPFPSLAKRAAT